MIKRVLPSCLCVSAVSCIGNTEPEARIIQLLFPIHDTADTQRHSGNNLSLSIYIYVCVCVCVCVCVHELLFLISYFSIKFQFN